MEKIKKGDKVGRISHGKDIIFEVKKIIRLKNGKKVAILKGITERIEVDSDIEDLCLIQKEQVTNNLRSLDFKLEQRIEQRRKRLNIEENRLTQKITTGKILHLDGESCLDNKNSH